MVVWVRSVGGGCGSMARLGGRASTLLGQSDDVGGMDASWGGGIGSLGRNVSSRECSVSCLHDDVP